MNNFDKYFALNRGGLKKLIHYDKQGRHTELRDILLPTLRLDLGKIL